MKSSTCANNIVNDCVFFFWNFSSVATDQSKFNGFDYVNPAFM